MKFVHRLIYLVPALILLGAILYGVDPAQDFQPGKLTGTIILIGLMAGALFLASWTREIAFDKQEGKIIFEKGWLGRLLPLKSSVLCVDEVQAVLLQHIALSKVSLRAGVGLPARYSSMQQARNRLFKLRLKSTAGGALVDQASYPEELEELGKTVARFLQVPYEREELSGPRSSK